MNILAIETSCDETACALVKNGTVLISETLATSREIHEATGGIVPEVAARKQVEFIVPVISETLKKIPGGVADIDALAVTVGPGLIGSLLVGVDAAKALSLAWNKPLVPVNHLIGHIYGNFVKTDLGEAYKEIEFPAVVLIVSGGHTDLVLMHDHGKFEYIGGTLDDAAGEAFDKTARILGIAKYLGGYKLSQLAQTCSNNSIQGILPRPLIDKDNFDFSFSGLKTSVKNLIGKNLYDPSMIACEFETAVVDVLVHKTVKAVKKYGVKSLLLGGGVSANQNLRTRMKYEVEKLNINFFVPPINLCTDNAVYIASAAYFNFKPMDIKDIVAKSSLSIID